MKKIAVIPARGGSKRIPGKNVRLFCGKPVIAYPIAAAMESGVFDAVIVSTDDAKIAEIARNYGAKVPFLRPSELASDQTPTLPVIAWNVKRLKCSPDDLVCCVYPTAALLQPSHLIEGLQKLLANPGKSYAFSCAAYDFTPWRAFTIESGEVLPMFPECLSSRSQDLKEVYHDAGAFYWGRAEAFCEEKPVFSSDSIPVVLPPAFVQDVDTLDDWMMAEMKYKLKHGDENSF